MLENFSEGLKEMLKSTPESEIWLKPHDWIEKAESFSGLVMEAALQIWKSCHQTDKGPDYLGRLEYARLYKMAESKEEAIRGVEQLLTGI